MASIQNDEIGNALTLIPEYLEVVEIEKQLSTIAKLHGGYAEGFGSCRNAGANT